jgi:hypothetical protein
MQAPVARPRLSLAAILVALAALNAALAACEAVPIPILRGSGSEHWQNIHVGLPF